MLGVASSVAVYEMVLRKAGEDYLINKSEDIKEVSALLLKTGEDIIKTAGLVKNALSSSRKTSMLYSVLDKEHKFGVSMTDRYDGA